ncbi:hypothetical protein HDU77_006037, partial [Chytriomyces hyalinus]
AQNRNAQKTFRERREQLFTNLQSKAEELAACLVEEKRRSALLQARLNSISAQGGADPSKCAFCGVDRATNHVLSAQIRAMELHSVALKMENDSLKMRLQMIGDTAAGLDPLLAFHETTSTAMGIANTLQSPPLDWPGSLIDTPAGFPIQLSSQTPSPDPLIPLLAQENADILQDMSMDFNTFLANVIPTATPNINAIPTANSSPSALNTSNEEWLDVLTNCNVQSRFLLKSTTEMFGPAQIEFARSILKSIPSLSNCSHVDILVNLFQGMTRMKEKRKIEATLARVVSRWYEVLDACSTLSVSILDERTVKKKKVLTPSKFAQDQEAVIQLYELVGQINKKHFDYLFQSLPSLAAFGDAAHLENIEAGTEPKGLVPENMMPLYNALMAIPGLEGSENVAGRLCQSFADVMYINQLRNNCSDPTTRAQEYCTKAVMDAFDNLSLEEA